MVKKGELPTSQYVAVWKAMIDQRLGSYLACIRVEGAIGRLYVDGLWIFRDRCEHIEVLRELGVGLI